MMTGQNKKLVSPMENEFKSDINQQAQEDIFSRKLKLSYLSLTFNVTCVTLCQTQKYLKRFQESKLDFKEHIKKVTQ